MELSNTDYVADYELCKQLYEATGWKGTRQVWWLNEATGEYRLRLSTGVSALDDLVPAYDIGYLLLSLPSSVRSPSWRSCMLSFQKSSRGYRYWYNNQRELNYQANTPQNAACLLAIALAKSGAL